jgi:hypothetical protein
MEVGDIIFDTHSPSLTYRLLAWPQGLLQESVGLALMQRVWIDDNGNVIKEDPEKGYNQMDRFRKWEPAVTSWRKRFKKLFKK